MNISLDLLSQYVIQNNPTEVKNNLMRMRLVDSNFEMSHDNFKSLLASLPQNPQYLTDVTANALDVLIDAQSAGVNYLKALQATTQLNHGEIVRQVASSTFQAAAQLVKTATANNDVVATNDSESFGKTLLKKSSDTAQSLTPLGWAITILVLLALAGGLWVAVSGISKKIINRS